MPNLPSSCFSFLFILHSCQLYCASLHSFHYFSLFIFSSLLLLFAGLPLFPVRSSLPVCSLCILHQMRWELKGGLQTVGMDCNNILTRHTRKISQGRIKYTKEKKRHTPRRMWRLQKNTHFNVCDKQCVYTHTYSECVIIKTHLQIHTFFCCSLLHLHIEQSIKFLIQCLYLLTFSNKCVLTSRKTQETTVVCVAIHSSKICFCQSLPLSLGVNYRKFSSKFEITM